MPWRRVIPAGTEPWLCLDCHAELKSPFVAGRYYQRNDEPGVICRRCYHQRVTSTSKNWVTGIETFLLLVFGLQFDRHLIEHLSIGLAFLIGVG